MDLVAPLLENNFGLRRHSGCYLVQSWTKDHKPLLSMFIDRMLLLPASCLVVAGLNISTCVYMIKKARDFNQPDPAVQRVVVSRARQEEEGMEAAGKKSHHSSLYALSAAHGLYILCQARASS